MNMEQENLNSHDTARAAATLEPGEEVVLVAKPRTAMDKIEMLARVVPGVAVLVFVGFGMSELREMWWLPLMLFSPLLVLGVVSLSAPWRHKRRMERTLYLLTNRRVLVLEPRLLFGERCIAFPLQPNPVKAVRRNPDGSGDIVFAYEMRWQWHTRKLHRAPEPVGFIAVPQLERVEQMIAAQVEATPAGGASRPPVRPSLGAMPTETDSYGNAIPRQPGRGVLIGFGSVFSVFSLVFTLLGVYMLRQDARFDAEGVKTSAIVVKVNAHRHSGHSTRSHRGSGITIRVGDSRQSRGAYSYYPVLRFTDAQGRVHEYESRTGSSDYNFPKGHRLAITYLPEAPAEFRIEGEDDKVGLIFTLAGGFMFLVGAAILAGGVLKKV